KSAQIREILISESAWEEMTCLFAPSLGINQVVAHNGNGGRERIGETGAVLGLNARDSKHAGRMFSMHNCQINPGAGPEITTPWKSYQHEKNRNGLMPLIRRRTMLQL
ncbi:DUF4049 domain-containing protein, partial [Escherichia coli]|uniref:DUF4049 domain-containing protein n=1 Tax=Escherichia coli TaxID=562 RepID=UPI001FF65007